MNYLFEATLFLVESDTFWVSWLRSWLGEESAPHDLLINFFLEFQRVNWSWFLENSIFDLLCFILHKIPSCKVYFCVIAESA